MYQTAIQEFAGKKMASKDVDLALTMRLTSLNINKALGSRQGVAADYGRLAILHGAKGELDVAQSEKDIHQRIYSPGLYLRRLLDLLTIFFLIKFTKKPLRFFGLVGSTLFGIGFIASAYLIGERLLFGIALADRPALIMSSLLIVLGIQIIAIGLIGEIIIFTHAKDLKEYKIDKIIS